MNEMKVIKQIGNIPLLKYIHNEKSLFFCCSCFVFFLSSVIVLSTYCL